MRISKCHAGTKHGGGIISYTPEMLSSMPLQVRSFQFHTQLLARACLYRRYFHSQRKAQSLLLNHQTPVQSPLRPSPRFSNSLLLQLRALALAPLSIPFDLDA
ncbi:hypothetical protein BVI434_1730012 [Burkholderia vietnamiensis]|nr:hypothetical protein BVI434_1730012 [Burkholderia vietnamiensis]